MKKSHVRWFILIPLFAFFGVVALFWYRYGVVRNPLGQPKFGVTFSTKYSRELGLDWQDVYQSSLDDLGIRLFRIPVYWDEIQPTNSADIALDEIQYMLDEAAQRDARVMLVVGRRVPRWPECHPPAWTRQFSESQIQAYERTMVASVVRQFRDHPALFRWQIENEPFFSVFGECPPPDENFIQGMVAMVRSLDPNHSIVVTDSGELSTWLRTADIADVLGISMYRVTWNSFWGYFFYPLPPMHYTRKAEFVAPLVEKVIVTELQVEPWVPSTILTTSLDEQFRSMNPELFERNIRYARATGFSEVLLWGVEWWYWLKEVHHDSRMWDAGWSLFHT